MQLNPILAALVLIIAGVGAATAQSLSPMHNSGATPSDVKGFNLFVGNPYKTRMTFDILPMDARFKVAATDATMAAGPDRRRSARSPSG